MLTKLLIIPLFFILTGFDTSHTDDFMPLPDNKDVSEEWMNIEEELEKKAKAKEELENIGKRKYFEDYEIKESECGKQFRLFSAGMVKNYVPFNWENAKRTRSNRVITYKYEYNGIFNHILNNIFASFGNPLWTIKYYNSNEELENALLKTEVDLAIGITYDQNPLNNIDYIYPAFFPNPIVAVFKDEKKAKKTKSFTDLSGHTGVTLGKLEDLESTIENFTSSDKNIKLVSSDVSAEDLYTYLLEGKIDYILTSLYSAQAYRESFSLEDEVFISDVLRTQQLFIGFAKNSRCRPYDKYFKEFVDKFTHKDLTYIYNVVIGTWVNENKKLLPYSIDKLPFHMRQKVLDGIKQKNSIDHHNTNNNNNNNTGSDSNAVVPNINEKTIKNENSKVKLNQTIVIQ